MGLSKARIAIIAPDLSQLHLINAVVALSDMFAVSIFSFNTAAISAFRGHNVPLFLFDPLADMPGYMRGLEERLSAFDAIIGIETYQLSSFQAMRAATKYKKPFGVISSTVKPFAFVDYPNIRAIQADLLSRSDFFWPTSKKAKEVLAIEGVPEVKMQIAYPSSVVAGKAYSQAQREKFRRYVKIPLGSLVFLFHAELDESNRPEEVVSALSILAKARHSILSNIRLLFVGEGHAAKDVRYRASDLGLGAHCLFLSQDPRAFIADLYSATDVMIVPSSRGDAGIARSHLGMLDAMNAGVIPMVSRDSQETEWLEGSGVVWSGESPAAMAAEFAKISLLSSGDRAALSQRARERGHSYLSTAAQRLFWEHEVTRLVTIGNQKGQTGLGVVAKMSIISDQIERGSSQDALIEIESEILAQSTSERVRAELYCLRGDAHSQLGNFDEALKSYQQALQTGQELQRAYRGLGFLSLKSHSHEEALTFFKRALAAEPEDSQSMLGIGMIYRRLKLFEDALYWAEKCLSAAPQTVSAVLLAAQTALETNAADVAIGSLERLREITNENRNIVVALAQLYMKVGRIEEANALFSKSDLTTHKAVA